MLQANTAIETGHKIGNADKPEAHNRSLGGSEEKLIHQVHASMGYLQDGLPEANQTGSEANVCHGITTMLRIHVTSHYQENGIRLNPAGALRVGGASDPNSGGPHMDRIQEMPNLHEDMVIMTQHFDGTLSEAGGDTGSRPSKVQFTALGLILMHDDRKARKQPVHKQGQLVAKQSGALSLLTSVFKIEHFFKELINLMHYRTEGLLAKGLNEAQLPDARARCLDTSSGKDISGIIVLGLHDGGEPFRNVLVSGMAFYPLSLDGVETLGVSLEGEGLPEITISHKGPRLGLKGLSAAEDHFGSMHKGRIIGGNAHRS